MKFKSVFIFLLIFFFCIPAVGQIKNEKEERITFSELPNSIKEIIGTLPKRTKRLKFYKETDGNSSSFEAKFKLDRMHYSLEFSNNGTIEDIEILIKHKALEKELKRKLANYFKTNFKKHRFIKIQKQHVFTGNDNPSTFLTKVFENSYNASLNFEIIAEVSTTKTRNVREFTFNSNGEFIKFRLLNPSSYEHVLY